MARYLSRFLDPDGTRYGFPTYPWGTAPVGLATRRQLAMAGLRPGGQPVCAQVMWRTGIAYLYRADLAKPKRTATAAQLAALGKALAARRRCPECGRDAGYVIPRCLGMCVPCHDGPFPADALTWRNP
jgi:hypothetical protein